MMDPYRPGRPGPSSTAQLSIIRVAMLAGVLMFGGVVLWLRRGGSAADVEPSVIGHVRVLAAVWLAVSVSGLAALFALTSREVNEGRRRTLSIIAWALGEGAALAGGVVFLVAGDARWYLGGVFVLLLAFILFPARRRD
jgi:hypothetical protein